MSTSPRESHRLAPPTTCCCHGDARCNDHFCARCGTDYPATPAPLDALCGAVLTCALPILHDGDHERADGIRWTWPAAPARLDVDRLARALFVICAACEPGEEYTDNHHRRHAEAIAAAYAEEAPDEGNEWQERNE